MQKKSIYPIIVLIEAYSEVDHNRSLQQARITDCPFNEIHTEFPYHNLAVLLSLASGFLTNLLLVDYL